MTRAVPSGAQIRQRRTVSIVKPPIPPHFVIGFIQDNKNTVRGVKIQLSYEHPSAQDEYESEMFVPTKVRLSTT